MSTNIHSRKSIKSYVASAMLKLSQSVITCSNLSARSSMKYVQS